MFIIELARGEAHMLASFLAGGEREIMVAFDPTDNALKAKTDGGIWTPPIGFRTDGYGNRIGNVDS